MQAAHDCPGDQIWMIGYTLSTIYQNAIRLLFDESPGNPLSIFRHYCTWHAHDKRLTFGTKTIYCIGADNEGAIGVIQGKTFDLCYCDEITLYPENVTHMIFTRLSMEHSMLFASMNPVHPTHIVKKWIDLAEAGDKDFYSMHFRVEDNPYLPKSYIENLKKTLTGLFYRRNYLGEWCLAEGAIFDFFERKIHMVRRPPRAAEFYLMGIDYGASNPFAAVIVGYNSGRSVQEDGHMWVEREYYWDPKNTRQKTNSEFARDLENFTRDFPVRQCYIDPSAASFKVELRKVGIHTIDADNDVYDGIFCMTNLVKEGSLTICEGCTNLLREIDSYVWDPKKSKIGEDAPLKQNDHAIDALRYCVYSFMKGKTTLKQPMQDEESFRNLGRPKRPDEFQPGPQRIWI